MIIQNGSKIDKRRSGVPCSTLDLTFLEQLSTERRQILEHSWEACPVAEGRSAFDSTSFDIPALGFQAGLEPVI